MSNITWKTSHEELEIIDNPAESWVTIADLAVGETVAVPRAALPAVRDFVGLVHRQLQEARIIEKDFNDLAIVKQTLVQRLLVDTDTAILVFVLTKEKIAEEIHEESVWIIEGPDSTAREQQHVFFASKNAHWLLAALNETLRRERDR